MWPNFFTQLPFPFPSFGRANFNTLPTVAVTVGADNVTLELPNHAFRNRDYVGGFYVNLRQAIPVRYWLMATSLSRWRTLRVPVSMRSIITSTRTSCTWSMEDIDQPRRHPLRRVRKRREVSKKQTRGRQKGGSIKINHYVSESSS